MEKTNSHAVKAMTLFQEGYNCAQAVLGAFCAENGLDFETAMKLAASFGGGMGGLKEVCGAASGMFLVAGLKQNCHNSRDRKARGEHYRLVRELAKKFEEKHGSLLCRELTNPFVPQRFSCLEIVGQAAELVAELG